jgi:hypothetical protein
MPNYITKHRIEEWKDASINRWTVLAYSHLDEKGQQFWLCRCECGVVGTPRASQVIRGISKGCRWCRFQASKGVKSPHWRGGKFLPATAHNVVRLSALSRGIEFTLTVAEMEDQWIKQEGRCAYTGDPLEIPVPAGKGVRTNASLDRIDSSGGYTACNIQWVLKEVNIMKMDMPEDVFLNVCRKIVAYRAVVDDNTIEIQDRSDAGVLSGLPLFQRW